MVAVGGCGDGKEEEYGVLHGRGLSLASTLSNCMMEINCHGEQMVNTEPTPMPRSLFQTQVLTPLKDPTARHLSFFPFFF